jgi:hypothetical protein
MQKWEYTCVSIPEPNLDYTELVEHLNKLGLEGWELISISSPMAVTGGYQGTAISNKLTYWLKRPKR